MFQLLVRVIDPLSHSRVVGSKPSLSVTTVFVASYGHFRVFEVQVNTSRGNSCRDEQLSTTRFRMLSIEQVSDTYLLCEGAVSPKCTSAKLLY